MCADRIERLIITVEEQGTQRVIDRLGVLGATGDRVAQNVGKGFQGLGSSASAAAPHVDLLRRALTGLGMYMGVRQLADYSDGYVNLQNRLRLVTNGTEDLRAVTSELEAISSRTRSSLATNSELYQRVATSMGSLGASASDALQFTESLNHAVAISGANSVEAHAGLIQLAQGLASGALRGDELRSVLEQLPAVADVIAKHFNVSRGALRMLGEQGLISGKDIFNAFGESRQDLLAKFNKTVSTIGQGFTLLGNSLMMAVGRFNESTGAVSTLTSALRFLGQHLGILAGLLTTIAIVALPAAIAGAKALSLALLASPWGLFATLAGAAVTALMEIPGAFDFVVRAAATFAGSISGLVFGAFDAILAFGSRLPAAVGDLSVLAFNAMIGTIRDMLLYVALQMNILLEQWESASSVISKTFGGSYSNWPRISIGSMEALPVNPYAGAASALGKETGKSFLEGFDSYLLGTQSVIEKWLKGRKQTALPTASLEAHAPATAGTDLASLKEEAHYLDSILGKEKERELHAQFLNKFLQDHLITLEQYNRALRESSQGANTLSGALEGVTRPILELDTSMSATSYTIGHSLVESLNSASGALADFAIGGLQDWNTFRTGLSTILTSISKMLLQSMIQMLVFKAIQAGIGGLFGGGAPVSATAGLAGAGGGAGVALAGLAGGGEVQGGRPYVVGEAGKELFIPSSDGRIIPNGQFGGQSIVVQSPAVTNIVTIDPQDVSAAMNTSHGEKVILSVLGKNKSSVRAMIS